MIAPKQHPHLLQIDHTVVVVVDFQERFAPHLFEPERTIESVRKLVQGASILRVPVLSATQNAEKLGQVVAPIREILPPLLPPFDKMCFSCYGDAPFRSEIERSGRRQVLICGIETHVCVNQTALDLVAAGYQVQVVADGVTSRTEENRKIGIDRMRQAGVLITSVETALLELLRLAGTPEFREISKLIK